MGLGGDDGSVATGNAGHLQTSSFDDHPHSDDDDDDDDCDHDDHDDHDHYHDNYDNQIMMISICILENSAPGNTGRALATYFPFLRHLSTTGMMMIMAINIYCTNENDN